MGRLYGTPLIDLPHSIEGPEHVAKPELGTKRICPNCSAKYYDLNRDPITCPTCGTVYAVAVSHKPAVERVPVAVKEEPAPAVEVEREEGLVSLEEAEEDAEPDVGPDADEDAEVVPEAETIAIEDEIETEDDAAAPFLEEEEEEGEEDVTDLLDVDEDEDEER
jgi:uncharacterized protein (TIGR02300 family)